MMTDQEYMQIALDAARDCADRGEVPVGAVIVRDGEVLAVCGNGREGQKDATAHAELSAIRAASAARGGWNLHDCTLYVTLEPCPMCAGAIVNARIPNVVVGAKDPKAGAFGSVLDLAALPLNHRPQVSFGILAEESAALLRTFFQNRRAEGKRWGAAPDPAKKTF